MTLRIALLRAVNVGGRGKIAMADLKAWAEGLGFGRVRTLLASGNLLLDAKAGPGDQLEALLEAEAARQLDLRTSFLVRDRLEWDAIVEENAFPDAAREDPGHLVVMALKQAPTDATVETLRAAIKGPEAVVAVGRTLYATYPKGISESKLTSALIERTLGVRGTARNWNTVLKIHALLRE